MMMNKFLILAVIAVTIVTLSANSNSNITNAQQEPPPPLEKPTTAVPSEAAAGLSLGKITIQISQTEQIIIDLPIKSDNKYQVVPIK